ncbi:Pentatricopeptide repeat-containing protein, mitochondrial [Tolypocladium capitatum]|uniref:Pentatricopeptide repeat-containing protein, mitochondrial n=1 Tax=Tolypocladium capitatum TaxID=45235 RepID=A0A2K3QBU3_9HYPO|nr:Pentatricopeptide repeat-containing protein, mitochondrial [Tolypocladium capitatum]
MYASRTTCWSCASRMRLAASARSPGAAALFSTLADAPSDALPTVKPESSSKDRQTGAAALASGQSGRRMSFGQRLEGPRKSSSKALRESAVALFNDVVNKAEASAAAEGAAAVTRRSSLGEWEVAAKMKELGEKRLEPRTQLRLFQADIWPHVKEMRGQMPKHLYMSTTQFLTRACDTVAEKGQTGSSVQLSRMCGRIGKWDLDVRNELVLNLCHALVAGRYPSAERNNIVEELVDMWKHISQLRRKSQAYHTGLQFVLPTTEEIFKDADVEAQRTSNMAPVTKALACIFVQFRLEQARELVPGLLATVAVLSDPRLARPGAQVKAAPLLNLVAAALQGGAADEAYVEGVLGGRMRFPSSKLPELQSYVVGQWSHAVAMLANADSPWRHSLAGSEGSNEASSSNLGTFHKQLRAAYRSRNTGAVVSIWQDLKVRLTQKPDLARQMREDPEFLDFWIFVWCAVRRPAKLQETLDLMREIRVQPTVKSYTCMMHGWKICKDVDKISALWDKLVESGTRLDAVIWTERISGLIEAGKPQTGIQALAEMMALWKQAVAKRGADGAAAIAVQPNIEVVNAAFKGLIRLDLRAANEVLAWAGREGIEPNIRTYNILLRESFRGDTPDDVQSLLRAMKAQGVEPDAATFTIILEEVLGVLDNTSAAEQVHAVQQVFADIEAAGLRANLETYGKMLYAVASLANGGADEAVAAVQAHMRAAGFSTTPHMVTILIERALARDHPQPGAVQALLREHGLAHVAQGDQTLWERVMSAYAATGDISAAMAVFADLARAGRPVTSLPCLTDLLRALLAAERPEDARDVVRAVLRHKVGCAATEGVEVGRDARYWRHHFWYMARENGLLNWAEVPLELQARLRGHAS